MRLAKGLNDHLPSSVQTKVPCATLASSNETLSVPGKREGHTWYQDGGKCDRRWSEWAQEHLCFHDTGDSPLLSHDRLPTQDWGSCFMELRLQHLFYFPLYPSTSYGVQPFAFSISVCGKKGNEWLVSWGCIVRPRRPMSFLNASFWTFSKLWAHLGNFLEILPIGVHWLWK